MPELKAAYRKAAALHHPDRGGNHQTMVTINDAYERYKLLVEAGEIWRNYYQPKSHHKPKQQPKPTPKQDSIHQIWIEYIDDLISIQERNEYKRAWVIFQLLDSEIKPPLEAWKYLAEIMGYKKGLAYYKFREWEAYPDRENSTK
jgi:curved DNA-binding protein CbpA